MAQLIKGNGRNGYHINTTKSIFNSLNQELKVEFKDKHLITDMKTKIEQPTVRLEKAFSGKEERVCCLSKPEIAKTNLALPY